MGRLSSFSFPLRQLGRFTVSSQNKTALKLQTQTIMRNCPIFLSNLAQNPKKIEKQEWYLSAQVLIERTPTLTPPLLGFEKKVAEHLMQIEYETSKKSEFELRHEADLETAQRRKIEGTTLSTGTRTAEDDSDSWIKDRETFVPRSRLTNADKNNDVTSTERHLDSPLHLVIEKNLGSFNNPTATPFFCWDMPSSIHIEGESIRETADRAIKECCGDQFEVQMLGNAPWGYYKTKYTKKIQEVTGKQGEKTFIFKAIYKSGKVQCQENVSRNYRWSTVNELNILPTETKNVILPLLYIDETDSS